MSRSRRLPVKTHSKPRGGVIAKRLFHSSIRARDRVAITTGDYDRASEPVSRDSIRWDLDAVSYIGNDCEHCKPHEIKLSRK